MCWDLNANGQADLPAEDINLDTFVNTLDCAGPQGATGADGAMARMAPQVRRVVPVRQDHKASLEPMARTAHQVLMVPQARRVSKASLEPMVRMVPPVRRVQRV